MWLICILLAAKPTDTFEFISCSELNVLLMCSPTTTGCNWKKTGVTTVCVLLLIGVVLGPVICMWWWLGKS